MKTSKTLKYLPVESVYQGPPADTESTDLKVKVFYDKGGVSYFSGATSPRGYYLSVTPVKVEKSEATDTCPGYTSEVFALFSGVKKFLEPAKVFSQKKFDALVPSEADVNLLVKDVLSKSGLKLKEEANVPA